MDFNCEVSALAPAFHTWKALSSGPDTILVPSWSKSTDLMRSLWALCFVCRELHGVSYTRVGELTGVLVAGWGELGHPRIPYFDRAILAARRKPPCTQAYDRVCSALVIFT